MPLPDLFGRRRLERELRQAVGQLERSVEAVEDARTSSSAAAEEAARAALEAQAAAASVTALLQTMVAEKPPASGRHVLRLVAFCVLALFGTAVSASFVPGGFTDPVIDATSFGNVNVLFSDGRGVEKMPVDDPATPVIISSSYSNNDRDVIYNIWIPETFQGWKFAIGLSGTAVIDDVQLNPAINHSSTAGRCAAGTFGRPDGDCQVIQGVFPYQRSWSGHSLRACDEEDFHTAGPEYSVIQLSGRARVNTKTDWAHIHSSLPSSNGNILPGRPRPAGLHAYFGQPLNGSFGVVSQTGCKHLSVDNAFRVTFTSEEPAKSRSGNQSIDWYGSAGGGNISVVSSRRNAEAVGNIALGAAGVFAALAIGLIPLTYERLGRWWRQRQSERSTP